MCLDERDKQRQDKRAGVRAEVARHQQPPHHQLYPRVQRGRQQTGLDQFDHPISGNQVGKGIVVELAGFS